MGKAGFYGQKHHADGSGALKCFLKAKPLQTAWGWWPPGLPVPVQAPSELFSETSKFVPR